MHRIMHINNEDQAREAIALWQTDPARAQRKNLKLAQESLELSQMYYEQKGNEAGIMRVTACLTIIANRIAEIEAE